MINWKKCAEYDLRDYRVQKEAIGNLERKIKIISDKMTSLRGSTCDPTAVHGGTSTHEDALITAIVEKSRLEEALRETTRLVEMVERGLSALSDEQHKILRMFFMGGGGYRRVMEEFHIEQAGAYRKRDEALRTFTLSMYGVTEL